MLIVIIAISISALTALLKYFFSMHNQKLNLQYQQIDPYYSENFSVYDHFEKIEKEFYSILKGKEKIEKITLWWGLDGLQINEDGTTEWIKRDNEIKKDEKIKNELISACCQTQNRINDLAPDYNIQCSIQKMISQREQSIYNQIILNQVQQIQNFTAQSSIMQQAANSCSLYPLYPLYQPFQQNFGFFNCQRYM